MKFPEIREIKRMRKALDITQIELSRLTSVSQSTIAKLENGRINASYEIVVRIFEALEEEANRRRAGRKAIDVSSKKIISIQAEDKVKHATELMRSSGYSQLPVFDGDKPVGSISEYNILALLRDGSSLESISELPVRSVMAEGFPIVNEDTPLETITSILSSSNAVLVGKKGKITGIITSSDVLKLL
ncbi:MAG: CBS domain-containing protein [Methanomassiliicoccales archaeon]